MIDLKGEGFQLHQTTRGIGAVLGENAQVVGTFGLHLGQNRFRALRFHVLHDIGLGIGVQFFHDLRGDRGVEAFDHGNGQFSRCLFDQFGGRLGRQHGHQLIAIHWFHQRDLSQRFLTGKAIDHFRQLRLVSGIQCGLQRIFEGFGVLGIVVFWLLAHDV